MPPRSPRARRPEVLFVLPPGGAAPGFTEHVGTGFLRAMLRTAGIAADQYLPPGAVGLADFARALRAARPRVVGLTVYESNLRACRALARVVRQVLPEAVLLAGGPNATFSAEETLDLLGVDACLRGAGEGTIGRLVEAVLGARAPRARLPALLGAIPNLVLRHGGEVVRTAAASLASFQREHFATLDDLPSPYQEGLLTTAAAGLLTARGCNQHCTYCSFAELSERRVAFHGVERVLEDLAAWRRRVLRGPGSRAPVLILDDAFTLAPERARAICEGIAARGLTLPFQCETRADRVDAGLLRLMRRAGFVSVAFGLESAVPRVLRAVGKVQAPGAADDPTFERERAWLEGFRAAVRLAREAGLQPQVSVIGGLPGETRSDFQATLDFVESLGVARYAHNLLAVMPGTPLHAGMGRTGLRARRDPDTGTWVTRHAFEARGVLPRAGSSLAADQARQARELVDALCGRPRGEPGEPGPPGALVLHGHAPEAELAAWLGEVLAIGGTLVVVASRPVGRTRWRAWARTLREAEVAHGLLVVLSPERARRGASTFRCLGAGRPHRIELSEAWSVASPSMSEDGTGRWRARLWLASAAGAAAPARARAGAPERIPQIADGCRWWTRGRRCASPAVLHVRADGAVAACWGGPALGRVGEPLRALRARARAMLDAAEGRCPLGPLTQTPGPRSAVEWYEVVSRSAVSHGGAVATADHP